MFFISHVCSALSDGRRLLRRLAQLYTGLMLYGLSSALLLRGGLGLEPWGVLHQGLAEQSGLSVGTTSAATGVLVLLFWIPIRQRPGLGTVSNVLIVGVALDGALSLLPVVHEPAGRIALLLGGILLNGTAIGLYITAGFGPGPRDGLMTGLQKLTGQSTRRVRTAIEVLVVVSGFLLGGSAGIGTFFYALSVGPLAQYFLHRFSS
ncbi:MULTISPECIES: hypothetical protein [Streptomyces]|uniref:Uncharacterized protein n=1 Tax=Streptomyces achmelvichensis TaxID=3134111 RepID=A0ACC6PLG7_9ACTN|nr:hypothetical protein [Streptomyces sp. NBC_00306]